MIRKYFMIVGAMLLAITSYSQGKTMTGSKPKFEFKYEKFTLENGLEVILHEDHSDPIVAVASMVHVGSNREKPGKTGFAHFFEHMSFNDSENTPVGANRKMIPEWGGVRNGATWSDGTFYYELVPKDAFEKILWIDSDRLGYMIKTVTEAALEREKQVVKNEKRERVDNAPYGYTDEIIRKNLYPEGHPYNWTVIGQLRDLQSATLDDVKEFYKQYYGAGNASLVIAGDIDVEETKKLVKRWFGEIPKGPEVKPLPPMPVNLNKTKLLYFEDDFATLPELRIVYPTMEDYHKDMYALRVLGQLLSGSKKSPLYKTIVVKNQLAPEVGAYQISSELAGEFVIQVRGNPNTDLDNVKQAIEVGLKNFESEGIDSKELKRIKAGLETELYEGMSTILNKAYSLVHDNEFKGDPGYIVKTAELTNAVTKEDVIHVYEKYIKGRNYLMTNVIPKGQAELAVEGSEPAEVFIEEVRNDVAAEEVSQGEEAVFEKTPSKFDRSEPPFGELPLFKSPKVWTDSLNNGMEVYGIESREVPLVYFDITIPGGQLLDAKDKAGVASLTSDLLMQGTANRSAAELEEALGLLGSTVRMSSSNEDFHISGTSLSKNFGKTMKLVEEILLEPRWDESEFDRLKRALQTDLKDREANPQAIATLAFYKLLYGSDHSFGIPGSGTLETAYEITLSDLKNYYSNLSPKNATFHIVGAIEKERVGNVLQSLASKWKKDAPKIPNQKVAAEGKAGHLYFINVPDAKQSVIMVGKLALSESNPEANKLEFANEILGGGSSGKLFQTLRIDKGYTYGAYSRIGESIEVSPIYITTSVRSNATLPSLKIIEEILDHYPANFKEHEVELTRNLLLKKNTTALESLSAKLKILKEMSKYNKPQNFIEAKQKELIKMKEEDYKEVIKKYIGEDEMFYLVVGDRATQREEIKKFGKPIVELDIYGNVIEN